MRCSVGKLHPPDRAEVPVNTVASFGRSRAAGALDRTQSRVIRYWGTGATSITEKRLPGVDPAVCRGVVTLGRMEIAAFVVAVLAVLAAGASAFYARGANSRADTANDRATEALDLQRRIDEREREFRDVHWDAGWDIFADNARPSLVLHNTGLTTAMHVTLVVESPSGRQMFKFAEVPPGETVSAEIETKMPNGKLATEFLRLRGTSYAVHWSSPLGAVESNSITVEKE